MFHFQVHIHLASFGLDSSSPLRERLLSTLGKCGDLQYAFRLFQMYPFRSAFTWTSLISVYVECDKIQMAFEMYRLMQEEGIKPDKYTIICLLKACGSLCSLENGKEIHDKARIYGLDTDPFVGSALINMYGKNGDLLEAENVFSGLCYRDIISWSAMISAYLEHQKGENALLLYRQMIEEARGREGERKREKVGLKPDQRLIQLVLKACSIIAENEERELSCILGEDKEKWGSSQNHLANVKSIGMTLHSYLRKVMRPQIDGYTGSALVTMYGKCGDLIKANHVFDGLSGKDVIVWTVMLSICVEQGRAEDALTLFRKMQDEGVRPDDHVFVIMLQACYSMLESNSLEILKILEIVQALHQDGRRMGYDDNVYIGSTLVTVYGKCRAIEEAEKVFTRLPVRDIVLWNSMLTMYVEQGEGERALRLYKQMYNEGMPPDECSFVVALQACCMLENQTNQITQLKSFHIGRALHLDARKNGFHSHHLVVSALISMYTKCGSLFDAEQVFNEMSGSNVAIWNVMLRVYLENDQSEKVLHLYKLMLEKCIGIDETTLFIVLQACSEVGSLDICKEVHFIIISSLSDVSLSMITTLINAYGSCASMLDAKDVFQRVPRHDVVSWNAIMSGLAKGGNWEATLAYFEKMCRSNIKPNDVTFLPILSVCNHYGLPEMATSYFTSMTRDYGIEPTVEHYASMLDLLVRAGDLVKVLELFSRMPVEPDIPMWVSLLSAFQKHGDASLAKKAFDFVIHLQPENAAAYIIMSNIYAEASLQEFTM